MTQSISARKVSSLPRLPFEGYIDFTYRCNFRCRHCWIRQSSHDQAPLNHDELSTEEWLIQIDSARSMGCRRWLISGGEPLVRQDFTELIQYISRQCTSTSLNTNGALITPEIARLLNSPCYTIVSLYGATAEVADVITQTPGSFAATLQGITYLKEAGAPFLIQIMPMKDNFHQYEKMIQLAINLCGRWRLGSTWLNMSSSGNEVQNSSILMQRLSPAEINILEPPTCDSLEIAKKRSVCGAGSSSQDGYLLGACIEKRRDFHIDPFGRMSFCFYASDPKLKCDLRKHTFDHCWNEFIPSLQRAIPEDDTYRKVCKNCRYQAACYWCPLKGYLENRTYTDKIDYLCDIAKERAALMNELQEKHQRFYTIGGLTIQVNSELPFAHSTFGEKFNEFDTERTDEPDIIIDLYFKDRQLDLSNLGRLVHNSGSRKIFEKNGSWIYLPRVTDNTDLRPPSQVVVCNSTHNRIKVYNTSDVSFHKGNMQSLTMTSTDLIFLTRTFALLKGCFFHSSGLVTDGKGLMFLGHSGVGKSTIAKMLIKEGAKLLCDDRILVRTGNKPITLYGNWHHGELPEVSSASAPLAAMFFLEQANDNSIIEISKSLEKLDRILPVLIHSVTTEKWWSDTLSTIDDIIQNIPMYLLRFDKSGEIVPLLRNLQYL